MNVPDDAYPAAAAPANWYPDPAGNAGLRYFDGSSWTEHYAVPTAQQMRGYAGADDGDPATADRALTSAIQLVVIGAAGMYFLWSLFGMMATDACTSGRCPHLWLFYVGYVLGWGGALASLWLVTRWTQRARNDAQPMWPRAALGAAVLVAAIGAWLALGMVAIPT